MSQENSVPGEKCFQQILTITPFIYSSVLLSDTGVKYYYFTRGVGDDAEPDIIWECLLSPYAKAQYGRRLTTMHMYVGLINTLFNFMGIHINKFLRLLKNTHIWMTSWRYMYNYMHNLWRKPNTISWYYSKRIIENQNRNAFTIVSSFLPSWSLGTIQSDSLLSVMDERISVIVSNLKANNNTLGNRDHLKTNPSHITYTQIHLTIFLNDIKYHHNWKITDKLIISELGLWFHRFKIDIYSYNWNTNKSV